MIGQRSVTGLAAEPRVLAFALDLHNVGVAVGARFASGVLDRPRGDLFERVTAVVPVLPEALRDQDPSDGEEEDQTSEKHQGDPNQVPGIPEQRLHGSWLCAGKRVTVRKLNTDFGFLTGGVSKMGVDTQMCAAGRKALCVFAQLLPAQSDYRVHQGATASRRSKDQWIERVHLMEHRLQGRIRSRERLALTHGPAPHRRRDCQADADLVVPCSSE